MVFMLNSSIFLLRIVLFKAYYLNPDQVQNAYHYVSYHEKMLIMLCLWYFFDL